MSDFGSTLLTFPPPKPPPPTTTLGRVCRRAVVQSRHLHSQSVGAQEAVWRRRARDYFSRSLNAPRYACDVLRIKSDCVDTCVSTQLESSSFAVSSSSLSTPFNIFSYASSHTRPFSLLSASTRSLVCRIRCTAASTSGVKFGV